MLHGKSLTDFTNLFSPNNFTNDKINLNHFLNWDIKMVETSTINGKANMYWHLNNGIQYRLNEIKRIKDYLLDGIQRLIILRRLLVLPETSGGFYCFICFCYWWTNGNNKRSVFSISNGIAKKLLKKNEKKEKAINLF